MFFLQMSGYPGSGKSTLSRLIGKQTGAIVLDHDIVKSSLLESSDVNIDHKLAGKISYNIEWALVDSYLSQGHKVILDSPCLYSEMIEKGQALSERHRVNYKYVECYLPDYGEINNRLRNRKQMISQILQAPSEEALLKTIENTKRPSGDEYLIVDTKQPVDTYIEAVMKYVNDYKNRP